MKTTKNFSYQYVDMLVGARTVLRSFTRNQTELLPLRTNWTPQYITQLNNRIEYALSHHLGLDVRRALKITTKELQSLQQEALNKLSMFKIQLEMDFSANKQQLEQILGTLGYTANYSRARKGDQEALIQQLYTFKENLTPELITEITAKGITQQLLDDIINLADPIRDINTEQEEQKAVAKQLTEEAVQEFNAIYNETMTICKVAAKVFSQNKPVKDQFVFSKVISIQNNKKKKQGIEGIEQNKNLDNPFSDPDSSAPEPLEPTS